MVAEARAYRVLEHVDDRLREMLIVADEPADVPVAQELAASTVAPVEALRVNAVQSVEAVAEVGQGAFNDEVVVRPHEAEGVYEPALSLLVR